jgi:peptide/nickel transport system ATP-binding protein
MGKTANGEAVKGVSFDIPVNSTVALVGESGSGKSVSAMSIVRLLPENAILGADSKILYNGKDLLQRPLKNCALCAAGIFRWCSRSP